MPSSQQLYLFDCDRQVEISVPNETGSIVIGRDSILQCNDTRISRNHGTLKLDANRDGGGLQITSTHSNPIFIRTGADGVLNILAKDLTATLQKGDKFALLPDQYWYEVRFREESSVPEEVSSTGPSLRVRTMEEVNSGPIPEEVCTGEKRKNVEDSEADCSKKIRTEDQETPDQPPEEADPAPETTSSDATSEPTTVIKPDPDASEETPAEGTSSKSTQDSTANPPEVKKETPDSSTGPPLRPSCQFGIACYRHTPDHRAQFAHPHDTDYRRPTFPPAPSDAPHCPFGASCYRRNPQHFRDLQHPDSTTVVPPQAPAAPMNRVIQVPLINVNALPTRRRANQFARDVLMAAIVNGVGADDDTESDGDDDDGRSLFGSGSESDEYNPDGDGEDDDDYGGHSESEQEEEEEEEQRDEE